MFPSWPCCAGGGRLSTGHEGVSGYRRKETSQRKFSFFRQCGETLFLFVCLFFTETVNTPLWRIYSLKQCCFQYCYLFKVFKEPDSWLLISLPSFFLPHLYLIHQRGPASMLRPGPFKSISDGNERIGSLLSYLWWQEPGLWSQSGLVSSADNELWRLGQVMKSSISSAVTKIVTSESSSEN